MQRIRRPIRHSKTVNATPHESSLTGQWDDQPLKQVCKLATCCKSTMIGQRADIASSLRQSDWPESLIDAQPSEHFREAALRTAKHLPTSSLKPCKSHGEQCRQLENMNKNSQLSATFPIGSPIVIKMGRLGQVRPGVVVGYGRTRLVCRVWIMRRRAWRSTPMALPLSRIVENAEQVPYRSRKQPK